MKKKIIPARKSMGKTSGKSSTKPFVPSPEPRVHEDQINLVEGKGSKKAGGMPGGHYWHIYLEATRVGRIYVNWVDISSIGPHASITIEINKTARGRGIGTIAYRKACHLTSYQEIFAHMRKSNTASKIAAERAGFIPIETRETQGLIMVWKRS